MTQDFVLILYNNDPVVLNRIGVLILYNNDSTGLVYSSCITMTSTGLVYSSCITMTQQDWCTHLV